MRVNGCSEAPESQLLGQPAGCWWTLPRNRCHFLRMKALAQIPAQQSHWGTFSRHTSQMWIQNPRTGAGVPWSKGSQILSSCNMLMLSPN